MWVLDNIRRWFGGRFAARDEQVVDKPTLEERSPVAGATIGDVEPEDAKEERDDMLLPEDRA
jgi:hypothetical protein